MRPINFLNTSKTALVFAIFSASVYFNSTLSHAADLDVVCDDVSSGSGDQCHIQGTPTLFDETRWAPGSTVTKTISVVNNDHNDDCQLTMYTTNETQTPSDFAQRLFTAIEKDGSLIYGSYDPMYPSRASNSRNLQGVFNDDVGLGLVSHNGGTANYEWTVTFDLNAGNEFQNAITNFDFRLNLTCDHDSDGSNDNDDDNDKHDPPSGTTTTPGPISTIVNFFVPQQQVPAVAGESTSSVKPETTPTPTPTKTEPVKKPEVAGVTATACTDPWWWILVFVAQALLLMVPYFGINRDNVDKKSLFYAAQAVLTVLFAIIFYKYFCPWWDVLLSLVLSGVAIVFTKRKIDKLLEPVNKYPKR